MQIISSAKKMAIQPKKELSLVLIVTHHGNKRMELTYINNMRQRGYLFGNAKKFITSDGFEYYSYDNFVGFYVFKRTKYDFTNDPCFSFSELVIKESGYSTNEGILFEIK